MRRWVGLLKGVNVGGNRKLPMAELKALVEALGYARVRTLLASGNVVFDAPGTVGEIEAGLEAALAAHGCSTDVLVRDSGDIASVLAGNPFPEAARDHPSHLLVTFHRDAFPDGLIEAALALNDGPERLHAIGRELYIDYPANIGDSKLDRAMARAKFPAVATARNWNTLNKLAALLAD